MDSGPELAVVCDVKEWLFYKRRFALRTPTKLDLFVANKLTKKETDHRELTSFTASSSEKAQLATASTSKYGREATIMVEAHETVRIPFRFQSWRCGSLSPLAEQERDNAVACFPWSSSSCPVTPEYARMQSRDITVAIKQKAENVSERTAGLQKPESSEGTVCFMNIKVCSALSLFRC